MSRVRTRAEIMKIDHVVLFRINSLNFFIPIDSGPSFFLTRNGTCVGVVGPAPESRYHS